jgi:transcriptional regulator with XRE-family HTH domain
LPRKSPYSRRYERLRRLLVEARRSANLTQAELAAKLSRPQSFVSKYERGERRLDMIEALEVVEAVQADALALVDKLRE